MSTTTPAPSQLIHQIAQTHAQQARLPPADPLQLGRIIGLAVWTALVIAQGLIFYRDSDAVAVLLMALGGCIGVAYTIHRERLRTFPISTWAILGFTAYYFLLPPVATFMEGKPASANLTIPAQVQIHAFACLIALIAGHVLYRYSRGVQFLRLAMSRYLYEPLGMFRTPSNMHLLLMGFIGIAATAYQVFVGGSARGDLQGAQNKLMQALYPLAYLPYCAMIKRLLGGEAEDRTTRAWAIVLIFYTGILVLLSLGSNSRAAFLMGVASVGLAYLYALLAGMSSSRGIRAGRLAAIGLLGVAAMGPATDLAVSMVVARAQRTDIPAAQLASTTWQVYQDKEALRYHREAVLLEQNDTDEYYLDNLFLTRMANLKFPDTSISLARGLDPAQRAQMQNIEVDRFLSVLPRPVLDALSLNVDKDFVGASSGGDLMLFTATGDPLALQGYRTGSLFGSGYALFGWLYVPLLSLIALFTYAFFDARVLLRRGAPGAVNGPSQGFVPVFNPLVVMSMFPLFFYFTSAGTGIESFGDLGYTLMRGWWQIIVIYVPLYWLTGIALALVRRPFER